MGICKKELANFLLPHIGKSENPDSAARLSCALLAIYAGCGKKIIEAYYPLSEIVEAGYAERHGTRWVLSKLAKSHLGIEEKKPFNPYFANEILERIIGCYGGLLKERAEINWDPIPTWGQEDWARGKKAVKEMIQVALASPHLRKGDPPERVARYVEQTLRAMIYSEGKDFYFFNSRGWNLFTLAYAFRDYVFRMRSLRNSKPAEKPSTTGRQKL